VRCRSHPLRVVRLLRQKIAINLWIPPSSPCCLFFLQAAIYPPRRWPDNCIEPAQTSPSSRGLNVGRGTDVGPRFTLAKECICNTRGAADEHPAVYWNFGMFFCTASARVRAPRSVSRNLDTARLIFDTPGLAVCDSSHSDPRTSVRSAEGVNVLA
jgi:hypothetical protein